MRLAKITLGIGGLLGLVANAQAAAVYQFLNFEGPGSGTTPGTGTNMNGIANSGAAVGFGIGGSGALTNFIRNADGSFTTLNIDGSTSAMALGINSAGDVVGTVAGAAFYLPSGGAAEPLASPGSATSAFGINDLGNIVGQYTAGAATPGFLIANHSSTSFLTINAPSGSNLVNAQGVNDSGLIVGFYVGTDGNDHGFMVNTGGLTSGSITGIPIADPTIPAVTGEPGATFVFSQVLSINDNGIAAGYYGDSTTSQHGFLYNTHTGMYTFLDDPAEAFSSGVEVTQITGINNMGDLTGFYSDANGVFHGFLAVPTPEPATWPLAGLGLAAAWFGKRRTRRTA